MNRLKVTQPDSGGLGVRIQLRVTLEPAGSGTSLAQYLTSWMVSGSKVGKMRLTSKELETMGEEGGLLSLKKVIAMRVHDGSQPRTFSCLLGRNVLLMLSFHQVVSCFLLGGQPPL